MTQVDHPALAERWSRLDGVDCLRALAIFYVLMNHVNMRLFFTNLHYLRGVPKQLAASLVWQGQAGVQIFFAVSGFLITSTSIRRWGTLYELNVREFYKLRIARIVPLLLTLLAVLSLLHVLRFNDFIVSKNVGGLKAALLAAITLRVGLLEATKGYLPGNWDILWSLSVEEAFYLIFPLACRFLGRGRRLVAFLILFVILGPFGRTVLAHGNETWQEYSYLGGMDAIALGSLTALLIAGRNLSRSTRISLLVSGVAVLVFCLGFSRAVDRLGLNTADLGMTVLAVGTCMILAVAAESRWQMPRPFRLLLTFGRRSYEIYLTHMFIVFLCFNLFMKMGRSLLLIPVLFLVVVLLSGTLGELIGRFYSEPANRWLRARWTNEPRSLGLPVAPYTGA